MTHENCRGFKFQYPPIKFYGTHFFVYMSAMAALMLDAAETVSDTLTELHIAQWLRVLKMSRCLFLVPGSYWKFLEFPKC